MLIFQNYNQGYQTQSTLFEKNHETQFLINQILKVEKRISTVQKDLKQKKSKLKK